MQCIVCRCSCKLKQLWIMSAGHNVILCKSYMELDYISDCTHSCWSPCDTSVLSGKGLLWICNALYILVFLIVQNCGNHGLCVGRNCVYGISVWKWSLQINTRGGVGASESWPGVWKHHFSLLTPCSSAGSSFPVFHCKIRSCYTFNISRCTISRMSCVVIQKIS